MEKVDYKHSKRVKIFINKNNKKNTHLYNVKQLSNEEIDPLLSLVIMIEKIVITKLYDKDHHQDEIEKHLSYLMQGEDKINPYERRRCGISDEIWQEVIKRALYFLNLREQYAKLYKN